MEKTAWVSMRWGILCALVLVVPPGTLATAASLRWKFQPGETLHYVMEQKTVTSVKAAEQDIKTIVTQTTDMDWKVKSVAADGVADMTQTITRVRTKIESAFGILDLDTSDTKVPKVPAAAGLLDLLKSFIGSDFSFKMSPRGELTDVKVPAKLVQSLRKAGGAEGGNAAGMFSEDGLKNMISEMSLALPQGEIQKGKSWTRQVRIPSPPIGTMVLEKTYRYEGADPEFGKNVERIDLQSKVEPEADPATKTEFKIKSQDGKGRFLFDTAAGRVTSSSVTEKIETVLTIQDQGKKVDLIQNRDATTTMKLVPKSAAGTPK